MKNILLIATGGTIACSSSDEGLTPSANVNELLSYIPHIKEKCKLSGISIMNIDSTNMNPELMMNIAKAIKEYRDNYDGFVVAHGTDTMGYTAAALVYMLNNFNKPVVITGSQLPMEAEYTDAKKNLSDAIIYACEGRAGVYVAFDGCIINGAHARKVKTRSYDAFESVNYPVVAHIKHSRITHNEAVQGDYNKSDNSGIEPELCSDVMLIKLFPGIDNKIFEFIKGHYKGVVIESFGIGGIPNIDNNIVEEIHKLIEAGVAVVVTTQCNYEGVDLDIYEVGKKLAKENVIIAADMTTEAVVMKLMWALAHFGKNAVTDIKKYIETPVFCDRSY